MNTRPYGRTLAAIAMAIGGVLVAKLPERPPIVEPQAETQPAPHLGPEIEIAPHEPLSGSTSGGAALGAKATHDPKPSETAPIDKALSPRRARGPAGPGNGVTGQGSAAGTHRPDKTTKSQPQTTKGGPL